MYGLVNKALQDLVVTSHGQAAWDRIKQEAGVEIELFISNDGYPDQVTYKLVSAASHQLGISADKVLFDFGRYWVLKTAREGYGDLMESAGRSLRGFLAYLPNFHSRVSLIFPHLTPPRFRCADVTANSMRLHYESDREGLASFVLGLLDGLGESFGTPVRAHLETARGASSDHDIFYIEWDGKTP